MQEILLIAVLIWGTVSLWIAEHANHYERTRAWGVLVFITGVFGMAAYAIVLASE